MNVMFFRLYCFVCVLIFSSCSGHKIKENFPLYQRTTIGKNQHIDMSDIQNLTKAKSIVINATIVQNQFTDSVINFKDLASSFVENEIAKTKYVTVLDRDVSNKITQELSIRELNNTKDNIVIKGSDYALLVSVNEILFDKKLQDLSLLNTFVSASTFLAAPASGGTVLYGAFGSKPKISDRYRYKVVVSGDIRLIELKTSQTIAREFFSKTVTDSEAASVSSDGGLFTGGNVVLKDANKTDVTMISAGLKQGITQTLPKILKHLLPNGYIIERKDYKENSPAIFRVSIGTNNGINVKDKVDFVFVSKTFNEVLKKDYIDEEIIPNAGIVSDVIGADYSWIVVKDKSIASRLLMGDYCKKHLD